MADINIAVASPGTFTITLDVWEWTGLTVNGTPVSPYTGPETNVQFQYTGPGPINWQATANQNLVIVNPGNVMILAGVEDKHTYIGLISYESLSTSVSLKGHLDTYDGVFGGVPGPILFSQGRMTGTFFAAS